MFNCLIRTVIIMLLCLGVVIASGCANGVYVGPERDVPAEQMLKQVSQSIGPDERIVAMVNIDVETAQGRYPVKAAIILQRPSYVRLELMPVIGPPDLFLTATPSEMKIFIPSRGEFYVGKPTSRNLERFLPWSLGIDDMVMILSGTYPSLPGGKPSYETFMEGDLFCVNMKSTLGESQTLWFTKEWRLLKLIRRGINHQEIYQSQYEDFAPDTRLAGKITIHIYNIATALSVRYSDVRMESSKDLSIFDLTVPPGSKIIQMN